MIAYILDGHAFHHEVQTIIQVFYPNQKYKPREDVGEGLAVVSRVSEDVARAEVYQNGTLLGEASGPFSWELPLSRQKNQVKRPLYQALRSITGYDPPWGMLTGIRPAKKMNALLLETGSEAAALEAFSRDYDVKPEKARLSLEVALTEQAIVQQSGPGTASLYIGIPFCPTRCLYCSFTAYPLGKFQGLVEAYLAALGKELRYLSKLLAGRELTTIYIGGGTPTSLSESQFAALLEEIDALFPVKGLTEYTVEAGRPDTITLQKLQTMQKHGVTRISINPQSMNDETLVRMGRGHSVSDVVTVFQQARNAGFSNINMDLILGLPGEGLQEVTHTLRAIEALSPDSLTVHTLAVKRASRLNEQFAEYPLTEGQTVDEMVALAQERALGMGMHPYYLYRQKNMVGSFENVGYAKPGFESPYNVLIMEETQTILAAGCGATTKVVDGDHIERVFNVKSLTDYIDRIDEMILRKQQKFGR